MTGFEQAIFDFLNHKYVQRADDRQKAMGLQYMEAETHDLAAELVRFIRRNTQTLTIEVPGPGMPGSPGNIGC